MIFSEGIRPTQIPCFLTSNLVAIVSLNSRTDKLWLILINFLGLLISITLRVFYGPGDFSKVKIRGPYAVGYREFYLGEEGNAVSVFYPISDAFKEEKDVRTVHLMDHGDRQVKALL